MKQKFEVHTETVEYTEQAVRTEPTETILVDPASQNCLIASGISIFQELIKAAFPPLIHHPSAEYSFLQFICDTQLQIYTALCSLSRFSRPIAQQQAVGTCGCGDAIGTHAHINTSMVTNTLASNLTINIAKYPAFRCLIFGDLCIKHLCSHFASFLLM